MAPMQTLYSMIMFYILKVKNLKYILKMVIDNEQIWNITFIGIFVMVNVVLHDLD